MYTASFLFIIIIIFFIFIFIFFYFLFFILFFIGVKVLKFMINLAAFLTTFTAV